MTDVRLVAILDPALLSGRDLIAIGRAAATGGATALQLRMKQASAQEYAQEAARLVSAVSVPVYVNDRADVAWVSGAAGVHLGADDLPAQAIRGASSPPLSIGVSVGTAAEAESARRGPGDYWSVGSVFATRHKADAGAPLGVPAFARLVEMAPRNTPVIAIGGITADRVPELMAAGASGVAVIGALLEADDPAAAARRLRDAVDGARRG